MKCIFFGEYLAIIHRTGGGEWWIFTELRSSEVNIYHWPPTLELEYNGFSMQ